MQCACGILTPVPCLAVPHFSTLSHKHHLLTPWCSVLLEKLTGLQLVKKFPAFHGTQRFITALTSATNFLKKVIEHKICVLIFSTFVCNICHRNINSATYFLNLCRFSGKVPVIFVGPLQIIVGQVSLSV